MELGRFFELSKNNKITLKYLKLFESVNKNKVKQKVIDLVNKYNVKEFDEKEFEYIYNKLRRTYPLGDNEDMIALTIYEYLD